MHTTLRVFRYLQRRELKPKKTQTTTENYLENRETLKDKIDVIRLQQIQTLINDNKDVNQLQVLRIGP